MSFFSKWCYEEEFQVSRIKFPLDYTILDGDFNRKRVFLTKDNWEKKWCYFDGSTDARPQFYDSFDHELKESNERVFAWHGVGTGQETYFYFKRIGGKWYLVKYEDIGT
jgi:hypothetical protein